MQHPNNTTVDSGIVLWYTACMLNSSLKWIATALTIAGAIAVSLDIDPLNVWLLNAGSILWLTWGIRIKEMSIVAVNAAMLVIYATGIFIRM